MLTVEDIREHFALEFDNQNFHVDRSGCDMLEYIGASFIANQDAIFGEVNRDYVNREIDWYKSQSTNIFDIKGETPNAWICTANDYGEINSNYGHLIYGEKFFSQYTNAVNELSKNPNSRRAQMIYTRPSIWVEAVENNKNDFICTNAVSYYIRDDKVHAVVQMRSNDVIFGYRNDLAWQQYVLNQVTEYVSVAKNIAYDVGDIHWQVMNLHIYGRHFYLVDHFLRTHETHITKSQYKELYPESRYA